MAQRKGGFQIKAKDFNPIPESLQKGIETNQKITGSMDKIIEHQHNLNDMVSPILKQQSQLQSIVSQNNTVISAMTNSSVTQAIGLLTKGLSDWGRFAIKSVELTRAIGEFTYIGISEMNRLASGLNNLINSPAMAEIRTFTSTIGSWLQTIDFTPLVSIVESIKNYGFEYDYEDVDEIYLKTMFDARWFPYAAWVADFMIVDAIFDILDTSRASQNRINKIDKLIFSYYNKEEMMNLKRGWRKMNLPSYMTRILIQSVQAYNRKEYALTVATLSTLWEGIIQEKVKDDSYRISRKTRDNLSKLIKENEFNDIFSSFCNEFIFYDCMNPEQVKRDVPGRHGIAHCWYNTYPNRKVALNAIVFTDFLLRLEPLDRQALPVMAENKTAEQN